MMVTVLKRKILSAYGEGKKVQWLADEKDRPPKKGPAA